MITVLSKADFKPPDIFMQYMKDILLALRPKHWIKNSLVILPMVFGRKLFYLPADLEILLAFLLFSLASSVGYLLNDIFDYEKDKIHPLKCLRPIASGKIHIKQAKILAFVLGAFAVIFSFMLNVLFSWTIIIYIALNIIYSKYLKKIVIIDVFSLGAFFLLRLIAGSVVCKVELSYWIIIMVVLLALFLGFNKRRQELYTLNDMTSVQREVLLRYTPYFIDQMVTTLSSSIVLAYMLYTIDARTVREFGTYHLLYTIPFVYYGIFRYLYLVHKVHETGDPTEVFFSDRSIRIDIILWVAVCIGVIYFGL